jgi:hypothetical protein
MVSGSRIIGLDILPYPRFRLGQPDNLNRPQLGASLRAITEDAKSVC